MGKLSLTLAEAELGSQADGRLLLKLSYIRIAWGDELIKISGLQLFRNN